MLRALSVYSRSFTCHDPFRLTIETMEQRLCLSAVSGPPPASGADTCSQATATVVAPADRCPAVSVTDAAMALLAHSAGQRVPVAAVPLNQQVRLIVKCPGLDPAFCLPGTVRRITVTLPNTSNVGAALQSGVSNTVRRLDSPIVLQARLPVEANAAPTQRAYVS